MGIVVVSALGVDVRGFDAGEAVSTIVFGAIWVIASLSVHHAIHTVLVANVRIVVIIVTTETSHASPPSGTASLPFCVASESVTARELPVTLGTDVRTFTGV